MGPPLLTPLNIKVIRVSAAVCRNTRNRTPKATENHPGVAKPTTFRIMATNAHKTDKVEIRMQIMPTRTNTSSAKTIKALNPCSTNPVKFILLLPA